MEYKNLQGVVEEEDDDEDDDDEIDVQPSAPLGYSPPSIRGSAFSKPILSPSSSLISLRGGGATSAAKNVGYFGNQTPSTSLHHATPAGLDHSSQSSGRNSSDPGGATAPVSKSANHSASTSAPVRYRECLRNHAAAIGGHVLDGCGEFMPEGDTATAEALKCAACGCHRSFHRKEADGDGDDSYYRGPAAAAAARLPLLLPPPPHPHVHHHHPKQFHLGSPTTPSSGVMAFGGGDASASGGTTTESSSEERINIAAGVPTPVAAHRKRFRTKFTMEQKEKMLAFAERVGWRFQKQDETLVEQFCTEVGVRKHVFKVWMHNNKHLIKKQQQQQQPSPLKQDEPQLQQQLPP